MRIGLFIIALMFLLSACGTSKRSARIKHQEPRKEESLSADVQEEYKKFVNSWIGTPYKFGDCTIQKGTDCSGLVFATYRDVFKMSIPRTTEKQYLKAKPKDFEQLIPGDLVFFDIKGKGASHVGMYLKERSFVHASSSKGVIISSLDDSYYKKHFLSFGSYIYNSSKVSGESSE